MLLREPRPDSPLVCDDTVWWECLRVNKWNDINIKVSKSQKSFKGGPFGLCWMLLTEYW